MEKKYLIQDIENAPAQELLSLTQDAKSRGCRLGQICATASNGFLEILYTFERDNILKNYKIIIDADKPELHSLTAIYPYAFIYENEIHDLFGVKFRNLSPDYEGTFFRIAEKTPWNPTAGKGGQD